jgi:hypothetical protein
VTIETGRPRAVGALTALLIATAAATVVVEVLAFRYAPQQGAGLAVRTVWALVRALGWLVLIWHVRRARALAKPLGLILAVTTIFAVGRLLVPESGAPASPGLVGFGVLALLCLLVVLLLYRHPTVTGHLVRHAGRPVLTRDGLTWQESAPRRAPISAWLLTARVAALTYSPLMLVPCLVSLGQLGRRPEWILAVVFWFVVALGLGFVVLPITLLAQRGRPGPRRVLVWLTLFALVVDLPLCWVLLGLDGLIRDGTPLLVAALLTLYALWRSGRAPAPDRRPARAGTT